MVFFGVWNILPLAGNNYKYSRILAKRKMKGESSDYKFDISVYTGCGNRRNLNMCYNEFKII